MKPKKKQKPSPHTLPPLPEMLISFDSEGAFGKVYRKKYFGKFSFSSTVIFSLSLPHLPTPEFREAEEFLQNVAKEYLAFLEEKSKKEGLDAFGGLSFSVTKTGFSLSAAFCSPKERDFHPVLSLVLSPEGRLVNVKKAARLP